MDRVILALDCERSGQVLLSANGSQKTVTGWIINGPQISLLTVAEGFKDEENQFNILTSISKNKSMHFARVTGESKFVTISKKLDDITIKVIEFQITEIPLDASTSSSSMVDVAHSLESHLAAAQAQLAHQAAELASLRQRCGQLADKYAAAVDETAGSRDRLLGAFCRVLNAKKALIGELLADRDGGGKAGEADGSETDAGGEGVVGQSPPSGRAAGRGGRGKRKSPVASAAASSSKPPVRRTRSSTAKKSRGGGGDDGGATDGENSD